MKKPAAQFPETRFSLLAKMQSDDDELAWQEFAEIYRPVVYRMACRRGLQDADAQDLSQKVLMSIARSIESWECRDGIPFRHWLRRVASNAILKELARRPRDQAHGGTTMVQMLDQEPADREELQRELELERQREIFLRAAAIVRADVEPESWQAFQYSVIDGLSVEETADKTGKSVGAVYAVRGRMMKRLRDAVSKMQESEQ